MLVFSISSSCSNDKNGKLNMNDINIIPKPKSIKLNGNTLDISLLDRIITAKSNDSEIKIAKMVQEFISPIKSLPLETSNEKRSGSILITIDKSKELSMEGYSLSISNDNTLKISSSSYPGLFYAYQTFRQLCAPQLESKNEPTTTIIPGVDIVDEPAFEYRGCLLYTSPSPRD